MNQEYKEQLRTHQEWVFNADVWVEVKYDGDYTMFLAADWFDDHKDHLIGKCLIQANQIVFSAAEDATFFRLSYK